MLLLVLWGVLMIVAFALIYQGLGAIPRPGRSALARCLHERVDVPNLGLGMSPLRTVGRLFILLEAGSGYIFLGLIITYMPVLEQAYGAREVGNLLIHSRAGRPPGRSSCCPVLRRRPLRNSARQLREAERWMAEILQSHLSHPVLSFYRAHRWGHSWLVP